MSAGRPIGMPASLGVWWKCVARGPGSPWLGADGRQAAARARARRSMVACCSRHALACPCSPAFIMQPRSEGFGAGLELVVLVARAAVVHQLVGVARVSSGSRSSAMNSFMASASACRPPSPGAWAAGYVDDREVAARDEVGIEQAAGGGHRRTAGRRHGDVVRAGGGDATPGRAGADAMTMRGRGSQRARTQSIIEEAGAGEHVGGQCRGPARAAGSELFDAQHVELCDRRSSLRAARSVRVAGQRQVPN